MIKLGSLSAFACCPENFDDVVELALVLRMKFPPPSMRTCFIVAAILLMVVSTQRILPDSMEDNYRTRE
jgi:hypothetical protein